MVFTGEQRSPQTQSCPSANCPPQIPHSLAMDRSRASRVKDHGMAPVRIYEQYNVDTDIMKNDNTGIVRIM